MKNVLIVLFFLLLLPSLALGLEVTESAVSTAVEQRQPVDNLNSVPADVGRVFCFTRIAGGEAESSVAHVWFWQGREMARVELPVRSGDWRTWSSKRILPEWTGAWQVSILDESGVELASVEFNVE